jgi:hypothetical protein
MKICIHEFIYNIYIIEILPCRRSYNVPNCNHLLKKETCFSLNPLIHNIAFKDLQSRSNNVQIYAPKLSEGISIKYQLITEKVNLCRALCIQLVSMSAIQVYSKRNAL